MIIGAFAAGLVLGRTDKGKEIERQVHGVAQFFIPIFFVVVGAAIDIRSLTGEFLVIGLVLTAVGVAGKILAGYAAWGKGLRRIVVGVGMVPRGEVGLIFAQIGVASGLLTTGLYGSVTVMVILTTIVTLPLLRMLLDKKTPDVAPELSDYVMNAPGDE